MNIVLLSGGSGKRLWPLSNDVRSKQFIKIFKGENGEYESMVQRVYRQICTVDQGASVTIATSKTQVSAIHNQLGENVGVCVEPCRRDTFPAIALATAYLHDVQHVRRPCRHADDSKVKCSRCSHGRQLRTADRCGSGCRRNLYAGRRRRSTWNCSRSLDTYDYCQCNEPEGDFLLCAGAGNRYCNHCHGAVRYVQQEKTGKQGSIIAAYKQGLKRPVG